ncbi:MAG: DNA phosphorothioation system sulfurtransferase DndC [Candidatus Sifarchaeia archaeon]
MSSMTEIETNLKDTYLADDRPWIIGFSGGKDSSLLVQLTLKMLQGLPEGQRDKEVHIISSNTLVESPLMTERLLEIHREIRAFVTSKALPVRVELLRPSLQDTFWVNLIGRGYPSPNRWFRWCTDRLKIKPATKYITDQVRENGEVVILLGARKSESASRSQTMGEYAIPGMKMRRHNTLVGAFVYTPLEDMDTKEVWSLLFKNPPPWGGNNRELLRFYKKADKELPLVIDTTTPASGGSRFGCWVCTVVDKDRALEGLIEDGEEWQKPLLEFRNWLKDIRDDPDAREDTRKARKKKKAHAIKNGKTYDAETHRGHKVLGPFTMETRRQILTRLLKVQEEVGQERCRLISPEELAAIQTLWVYEGESPRAVKKIIGKSFDHRSDALSPISPEVDEVGFLEQLCKREEIPLQLIDRLLAVESDLSGLSRRRDLYSRLERVLDEHIVAEMTSGGR